MPPPEHNVHRDLFPRAEATPVAPSSYRHRASPRSGLKEEQPGCRSRISRHLSMNHRTPLRPLDAHSEPKSEAVILVPAQRPLPPAIVVEIVPDRQHQESLIEYVIDRPGSCAMSCMLQGYPGGMI